MEGEKEGQRVTFEFSELALYSYHTPPQAAYCLCIGGEMLDLHLLQRELQREHGEVSEYPIFGSVSVYEGLHVYE